MPEVTAAPGQLIRPSIRVCLAREQPEELHDIRIALTGSWVKNGKRFSITKTDLSDICTNFNNRKNGTVVIDYDHASEMPEVARGQAIPAAGWVKGLAVRNGDLIASVQWTEKARELIKAGEYKFVSPAIDFEGHDKADGEDIGACLTSVALTNHPFLEELPPLMLSEAGASLADLDSDKVIHVPIPDDGKAGYKVKVKVEKKPDDKDEVKMAEPEVADEDLTFAETDEQLADASKTEGGSQVDRSKYAFVGDPDKKSTWKYRVDDAAHARNALARWGQHTGIPKDKEPGVLRKIVSVAKRFGVKVDKNNPKYKTAASDAVTLAEYDDVFSELTEVETMGEQDGVKDAKDVQKELEKQSKEASKMKASETFGDSEPDANKARPGYIRDQKDLQTAKHGEARTQADSERGDNEDASDDAELSEVLADLPLDDNTGEPPSNVPRFKIRGVKSKDGVGKLRHHAVVAGDGKLCGYVTNGDFQTYAKKMVSRPPVESSERMLANAIHETTGRPLNLREVTRMVEFSVEHQDEIEARQRREAGIETLLSEMFKDGKYDQRSRRSAQKMLLNDAKLGMNGRESQLLFIDIDEAMEVVDEAIKKGYFVPPQREALVRQRLSNEKLFDSLMKNAQRVIDYRQVGMSGTGEEGSLRADEELTMRTKQYMKENNITDFATAARMVMHDDRHLTQRYREERTKGPVV